MRSLLLAIPFVLLACDNKDKAAPPPAPAPSAATTTTAATTLKEGDPAPDVDMTLQDGKHLKLSSLKGKPVVVYFYPKDETTGCTIEAQDFKGRFDDLKKADITVVGVSTQDAASHQAFIDKEKLPFNLAVDQDKSIAKAFGVPLNGGGMAARQTFLIGKDGTVKKIWRDVKPKDHATEVLSAAST